MNLHQSQTRCHCHLMTWKRDFLTIKCLIWHISTLKALTNWGDYIKKALKDRCTSAETSTKNARMITSDSTCSCQWPWPWPVSWTLACPGACSSVRMCRGTKLSVLLPIKTTQLDCQQRARSAKWTLLRLFISANRPIITQQKGEFLASFLHSLAK